MDKDEMKSFTSQSAASDGADPRELLKAKLLTQAANSTARYNVPAAILQSDAYCKLQERVEKRKIIPDMDPLWDEIEQVITSCSPNFRRKLNLLTSGHVSIIDFHTALLLKCGIKPSHMTVLAGRSQGSIVSRRETLGRKILDEKMTLSIVDRIIQLL